MGISGQSAGIERISWSTGHLFFDLEDLAQMRGQEAEKYTQGIGQKQMSFCLPSEDVVTMACEACYDLLAGDDHGEIRNSIRLLIFATESSVDQSKAAGMWVHRLLGLPSSCRVVEMKQACYSTTAAVRLATSHVEMFPEERALVIGSDEAIYSLETAAEPTQGAGAVALLISSKANVALIDPIAGLHSEESNDFWRPNRHKTPIVDGKLSTRCYLNSMKQAIADYHSRSGPSINSFAGFCFHTPFPKMAHKALHQLLKQLPEEKEKPLKEQLKNSLTYCEKIGNCYSASLWIAFASTLNHGELIDGDRIGLFSYGSGSVGEFLSVSLQPGFSQYLHRGSSEKRIMQRKPLSKEEYTALHRFKTSDGEPDLSQEPVLEEMNQQPFPSRRFYFIGHEGGARLYEERDARV